VEVGCGLGYFSQMIKESIPDIEIVGLDISESAILKARKRFKDIRFEVGDALDLQAYTDCEAVLFAGVTWYILEDYEEILANLSKAFKGKYFINWMPFYREGVQEYGREYFTTIKEYIDYIPFKYLCHTEAWAETNETTAVFEITPK
jgi:trans-aconitate methyltransferase